MVVFFERISRTAIVIENEELYNILTDCYVYLVFPKVVVASHQTIYAKSTTQLSTTRLAVSLT